ncbi:MAG: DMT family transporter, partial [bacterium]|nr:DMT family transporter [bacterium]
EGLPPFLGAASRFLWAFVVLYLYVKWKRISLEITKREFWLLMISALLMYVLDYGLLFWGEQFISAGVTSIFFSTYALFTALLSNFVFKNEPFSWKKFNGLMVGFAGILIIFYDQLFITQFNLKVTLAVIAVLGAAMGAALATVVVKKYLSKMNVVKLSFYQMFLGTIYLGLLALFLDDFNRIQMNARVFIAVAFMGVIASAVAFVIYYDLLSRMSAVSLSFIIYVIPLVALAADYIIYGEVLTLRSMLGMGIVFSGIWLNQMSARRAKSPVNRSQ